MLREHRVADEMSSVRRGASDDAILLGLLGAVERDPAITQRSAASELGIALGLVNAYLKRCIRKGLIKVAQAPARRYTYYLTPHGFAEKARLTGQYLSASFHFFRRAREQMSELLDQCVKAGRGRIAFAGVSDLAEVGRLCAHDHGVILVGIIDQARAGQTFYGLPVRGSITECGPVDVVIVTSLTETGAVFAAMEREIGQGRVLAPRLLQVSPARPSPARTARAT